MIRQKRLSINRISQNTSNISRYNRNAQNLDMDCQKQRQKQAKKCILDESRNGLSEIVSNGNNRESTFMKALTNDSKCQQQHHLKNRENIFAKIEELIKIQDIPMPICHSNKMNPLKGIKQRPYTSFSHQNKITVDHSHLNKLSVVLDFTKNDEPIPPERSSTSRALMNFSKVYRNNSNDGFRVKKNMSIINRFVHLSAQKVVFQEKEKRQKTEKVLDRTAPLKKFNKSKMTNERYEQEQDFQIGGWDYFQ